MTFDKSKVYTALNAEELEVGSVVILADCLELLRGQVEANSYSVFNRRLDGVMGASSTNRFKSGDKAYNLAYLVRKVGEEEPEEEKWIAYLCRPKNGGCYLTACREDRWKCVQEDCQAKTKLFIGTEREVEEWYKARRKFAEAIKAWEDGKEIQFSVNDTYEWQDIPEGVTPQWFTNDGYRVKPEEECYVAYVDHYEPHLDFGSCAQWDKIQEYKGAKNKLFVGSMEECRAWCDSHDKFAEEILAWENGKELQFRPNDNHLSWQECANPTWNRTFQYRVKPNGLVWTDLKMGDILWRAGERPAPFGGRGEYVYFEERRMVTGIVDDPGTKRHVQLGGDWIDDKDLEKWSVEE